MTRLFLRFYAAVLLILFAAWLVQGSVFRLRANSNYRVVEHAMAGGVRSARERLAETNEVTRAEVLSDLQSDFEFPVEVFGIEDGPFSDSQRERLRNYNEVVLFSHHGTRVGTAIDESTVVALGPLPSFNGPSQWEVLAGLGIILSIAATAIALVLRPVVRQLRAVEQAATAIAAGNLSARIDPKSAPKGKSLATAFNTMANRTEDLLRTQRELLQAVSHDLRTPLARMRFAIDLIRLAETDEEREPRLASLDAATEELSDLVGELLNYVRMETADSYVQIKEVALFELLQRLVAKRSPMYPDLTIEIECSPETMIKADETGLQRAVGNLLANACRFAKQRVKISVSATCNCSSITIEDDGDGIPEADRKRVLNPFVRLNSHGKHANGVGLGLALVNRIVKAHGGEIKIEDSSSLGGCLIRTEWRSHDKVADRRTV
jgi:two-component system, OmpR family, sensor histidine kinase RstB